MYKILILEDDPHTRLLFEEEFEDEGYEVILTSNGSEALKKFKDSKPDIAILDIKMEGMDGIEVLRKMKEIDKNIPVVLCTAYTEYQDNFSCWACDAYIIKSSDTQELKNTVKKLLPNK